MPLKNIDTKESSDDSSRQFSRLQRLEVAWIEKTEPHTKGEDKNKHIVKVRNKDEEIIDCQVATTHHGSVYIPPEDSQVLIGYREDQIPVVLHSLYPFKEDEDNVPSYEVGEVKIGHPISGAEIYLNKNGELKIQDDHNNRIDTYQDGKIAIEDNAGSKLIMDDGDIILKPIGKAYLGEKGQGNKIARKNDKIIVTGVSSGDQDIDGYIEEGGQHEST